MLITLLLVSQVGCEWVEIAQQHYQKPLLPVRPTHNYPLITTVGKVDVERNTKGHRIYINHSLPEYNWNKGFALKDYQHNVNRVQLESSIKRLPKPSDKDDITKNGNDVNKPQSASKPDSTKKKTNDNTNAIQQKFPNNGIRRVQILGAEKLPTRMTPEDYRHKDKQIEVLNLSDLDTTTEEDLFTTVNLAEGSEKSIRRQPVSSTVSSIIRAKPKKDKLPERSTKITEIIGHSYKNNKPTHVIQTFTDAAEIETEDIIQRVPSNSVVKRVYFTIDEDEGKKDDMKSLAPVKVSSSKPSLVRKEDIHTNDEKFIKNDYKMSNTGKIRRVQLLPDSTIKTPAGKTKPSKVDVPNQEHNKASNIANRETEKNSLKTDNAHKKLTNGSIHRMPNIQMQTSTTEKTAKVENNRYNNFVPIKRLPDPEEVMIEEMLKEEEQSQVIPHKVTHIASVKRVQLPNKNENLTVRPDKVLHEDRRTKFHDIQSFENDNEEEQLIDKEVLSANTYAGVTQNMRDFEVSSTEEVPLLTTAMIKLNRNGFAGNKRPNSEMDIEQITYNSTTNDFFESDNDSRRIQYSTEEIPEMATATSKRKNFLRPKPEMEMGHKYKNPKEVLFEPKPTFVTKEEKFPIDEDFIASTTSRYFETFTNTVNTEAPLTEKSPASESQFKTNKKESKPLDRETENQGAHNERPVTADTKAENIENVVKLIKVVTDTISRNTRRNFKSKMRYLEDLRDTILVNIEDRIESAFPDDDPGPRRSRSVHRSARGHIEFPSSEGALMTISFLTFAVFLIKLVLQVIQTYKNKTMMVPMVAAVGRAVLRKYRARN